MSRKIVLGLVAAAGAAACAFVIGVLARKGLVEAGLVAGVVAALAGVPAAVAAVWVVIPQRSAVPLPPELDVPDWVIGRPAELTAIVKALVDGRAGTVGITTGLYGAGGFGKTTLAQMVCADRRVRRRFGGRVYLVTVGRDVRGAAAVAAKVNDVIKLVAGADATFTDPQLAGQQLGSLLDGGPVRLLVLDDVWEPEQLAPFAVGGKGCTRLVTTRVPELVAGRGTAVPVDQMSPEQARALLTSGLPHLDPAVVQGLLAATGRWPLLLRLVNKILADYTRVAVDVGAHGAMLLERLRTAGPAAVDDLLLGDAGRGLDVGQPQERARAVRATIEASTSLLSGHDAERFVELSVFAEDEAMPFSLVTRLWRATAGLDDLQAQGVCNRLAQLALVSQVTSPTRGITLHDVVRDFLRAELGQGRLAELNGILLDTVAAALPTVGPIVRGGPRPVEVAWWELARDDRYLWDHLVEHLLDAERPGDADAVAGDLRWVGARLERFGPAAPAADLSVAGTPRAARLRTVLTRTAHLLAPTEPTGAVIDVLHSRVADNPDWGPQVTALRDTCRQPRMVNLWPLPDLADPALRRALTGHTEYVEAVAVAPDGSWLASGSSDRTVRIWDVATGRERAVLKGHTEGVEAVAVAPDGSWLASGSSDRTVRIWDVATGRERAVLKGHTGTVRAVAVAPDGSWLASGSSDRTVRIWDVATGRERAVLKGHTDYVRAVAVAPDGSWLASGSSDETVRIWDVATGRERAALKGHTDYVRAVAVAPDGSWLASGSDDRTVRIWDVATGRERAVLKGHTSTVEAVAVAPDGSWLASGSWDRTVRIWDVATERERAVLKGHTSRVAAVAVAPDGSWLASGSSDRTVRIWDVATGRERAVLKGHTEGVEAVAVAPDGSWLASGSSDETVRIWDVATGRERAVLKGHTGTVRAVAVAPDGSWLASGSSDGTVRIWDVATERERAVLKGHTSTVEAVAAAPDGSWLASGSWDRTVRIWDVATGRERAALKGHADYVMAVAVAPDGSWLASGSSDETVRIWDVATGRERAALKGHTGTVRAVAVAPDGSWLASGSDDQTVRIWDVATGRERAALKGHTSTVEAVAADGSWLASGSRDGTVRISDVAIGQTRTLMRVDNNIKASAWLSSNALAVGGSAGLYLFGFLTGANPVIVALDDTGRPSELA